MLDLSPDKLFMLAVVALVVLGPGRLPGAARSVGRVVGQMRAMSASLQTEMRDALADPEDAFSSALAEFHPGEVRRAVRRTITDVVAPFESGPGRRTTNETSAPAHVPPAATAADPFAGVIPVSSTEVTVPDRRPNPDDPSLN